MSRSVRTSAPASGNAWRTQGGMTEFRPTRKSTTTRRPAASRSDSGSSRIASIRWTQASEVRILEITRRASSAPADAGTRARHGRRRRNPPRPRALRRQPVERGQQIRVPLSEPGQRLDLVPQDADHEPRVELRIVDVARLKAPVLMVFDEVVVRVLRKRERVEP